MGLAYFPGGFSFRAADGIGAVASVDPEAGHLGLPTSPTAQFASVSQSYFARVSAGARKRETIQPQTYPDMLRASGISPFLIFGERGAVRSARPLF
jgi:hypothetical protein